MGSDAFIGHCSLLGAVECRLASLESLLCPKRLHVVTLLLGHIRLGVPLLRRIPLRCAAELLLRAPFIRCCLVLSLFVLLGVLVLVVAEYVFGGCVCLSSIGVSCRVRRCNLQCMVVHGGLTRPSCHRAVYQPTAIHGLHRPAPSLLHQWGVVGNDALDHPANSLLRWVHLPICWPHHPPR